MNIITSVKDQQDYCQVLVDNEKKISLIPTMGNLHLGHESLFKASADDEVRISSVFVNPLQFNDKEDYINYPKSLDRDIDILKMHNIDCLFMPDEKDIISYRLDGYYNPSGLFNTLYLSGSRDPLCVAKQGYMPIFNC